MTERKCVMEGRAVDIGFAMVPASAALFACEDVWGMWKSKAANSESTRGNIGQLFCRVRWCNLSE